MASIAHNEELLKNFLELVENFQPIFKQKRTYVPSIGLMLGEMMTVARHTITQILLTLGLSTGDWSVWYRLFSAGRIDFSLVSDILFPITLRHVVRDAVYVVAGDSTQRPRSGDKIEGAGWLHNPVSPPFKPGVGGVAQRRRVFGSPLALPVNSRMVSTHTCRDTTCRVRHQLR